MRGRIIFINPQTSTGLIFGADRGRYNFELKEWAEPGLPKRNLEVNFQAAGGDAIRIKPFSVDYTDEALLTEEAPIVKKPRASRAKKNPELVTPLDASLADDPLLDDEIPAGISPKGTKMPEAAPLTAKLGNPAIRLDDRILLDEEGMSKTRPSWQYYLIGVGAFLILLLAAFLIRTVVG